MTQLSREPANWNPLPPLEHSWWAEAAGRQSWVPDTTGLELPNTNVQAVCTGLIFQTGTRDRLVMLTLHCLCLLRQDLDPGVRTFGGAVYTQSCQKALCKHGHDQTTW